MTEESFKASCLKNTLHGCLYQWSLLTWVAIKNLESNENLELISDDSSFEKFDDLVLKHGENRILFFHSSKKVGLDDYKMSDFTTNNKSDAYLAKYFDSWYRLENKYYHIKERAYICNR